MSDEVLVSILCITYNQENFIRQCLDSFMMQKTNFKFEVLIHDDASTDKTADIIREYEKKYPDIIKPIYQTENQWSKGLAVNRTYNYPRITGKYVAMCEGDDYWTDPYKLQKQVDFLEKHPDYSLCASNCLVEYTGTDKKSKKYIPFIALGGRTTLTNKDLWYTNFIPTNTIMYRWDKDLIKLYEPGIFSGDWYLNLLFSTKGKIKIFPFVSGVYRKHNAGISWLSSADKDSFYLKNGRRQIKTFYFIYKNILNSSEEYAKKMLTYELSKLIGTCYKNNDIDQLKQVLNDYPELVGQCIYERQAWYKKWFDRFLKLSIVLGILLGLSIFVLGLFVTNIL